MEGPVAGGQGALPGVAPQEAPGDKEAGERPAGLRVAGAAEQPQDQDEAGMW